MKMGFEDRGTWILPLEGNLGNKATNLLNNTSIVKKAGFKVPRSLVIPYYYLNTVDDWYGFLLEQSDKFFPGWTRLAVRSNASHEDINGRTPGLYHSDTMWHEDRTTWRASINKVLESYNSPNARSIRNSRGVGGVMCFLVQPVLTDTVGIFDAKYSGSFSDISEMALLTFTDSDKGMSAMESDPLKKLWVDSSGNIEGEHSAEEGDLAKRLRTLSDSLPELYSRGWEIEFVGISDGDYVVQTTPVYKRQKPIEFENESFTRMTIHEVVGFGDIIANGILSVSHINEGSKESISKILEFNERYSDYCIGTVHRSISDHCSTFSVLDLVGNANMIIDISGSFCSGKGYKAHVAQFMRERRVAIAGYFRNNSRGGDSNPNDFQIGLTEGVYFSPTRIRIQANEYSQMSVVTLPDGKFEPFVPIEKLLK